MRRAPGVLLLAALAFAGSGCSSVPSSSKATVVGAAPTAPAPDAGAEPPIRIAGPKRDDASTPEELVAGFLDAEQDTSKDGTAKALDYLSPATAWDATGETLVYTTKRVELGESIDAATVEVRVTYSILARIVTDEMGAGDYRPDVGPAVDVFTVKRSEGGYRISDVPRGRRVDDDNLEQVFRRVVPYFYSTVDYDTLIPEPIFLLKHSTPQVAALVNRLLVGPTPLLRDFLPRSLFPPGTELLTAPDPEDNIVEVTFNGRLGETRFADRPKIVAQIVWTLTTLDSRIAAVTIKVSDEPFRLDDDTTAEAQGQAQWPAYDPDAPYRTRTSYFNFGGALGSYRPSSAVHAGRTLGTDAPPAVDSEDTTVAVTAQVGPLQELRVGPITTGPLVPVLQAEHLTKPSWGAPRDGVFVVGQQGDAAPVVYYVPGDANPYRPVRAPELNSRVHAFEIAPDGLRVAAIVERDGRRSLEIGQFDRSSYADTSRGRVGGFRPVVNGVNVTALSLSWVDSGKLAFIGQRGEEDPEVFTVLVDGTELATVSGSRAVMQRNRPAPAAQPQLAPVAVRHESGDTRRGDGSTPVELLLVIDGDAAYVRRGQDWTRQPARQTSGKPATSTDGALGRSGR